MPAPKASFRILKSERIRHQKYQDTEELRRDLFRYVEYFTTGTDGTKRSVILQFRNFKANKQIGLQHKYEILRKSNKTLTLWCPVYREKLIYQNGGNL